MDLLKKQLNKALEEIYFNQVSPTLEKQMGNLYHVPHYDEKTKDILNYAYSTESLRPVKVIKKLGSITASMIKDDKDHAKPMLASILMGLKKEIGIAHYEPHCGQYAKIINVEEKNGYEVTVESLALPFEKELCRIKSIHD